MQFNPKYLSIPFSSLLLMMDDQQKNGWMNSWWMDGWMKKLHGWECCQFTTCKCDKTLFLKIIWMQYLIQSIYLSHEFPSSNVFLGYLFCFISISWGCLTSSTFLLFFFFCNEPIWLAHSKKKLKLWRLPHRRFYGKMECLPLWPTYIGAKGRTLGKTFGIKARCYWEHPWGTHWELRKHTRNLMTTN